MKTKTIQFTGLALGLAIAAGSIGTTSLFFNNGRQNAIDAQAENFYAKLARYDFSQGNTAMGELDDATTLARFSKSADTNNGMTDIVTAVSGATNVYGGFTGYLSYGMKLGGGAGDGSFSLSTSVEVNRAVIVAAGWSATDSFSVGGADAQVPGVAYNSQGSLKTLTFDFEATSSIDFVISDRGFIQSIEFYSSAPTTFHVTYDGNGALSGSVVDDMEYEPLQAVIALPNGFTNAAYLEFAGWNTMANGKGTAYQPSDTFNITFNTTLYAQWAVIDVELEEGAYSASFTYENPIPENVIVKADDVSKGAIEVTSTGIGYLDNYREYDLAKSTGQITFTNRTNAKFTKVVLHVYRYDNYYVYADDVLVHDGDTQSGYTDIEIEVDAETTIRVQNKSSRYTTKLFGIDLYLRVGSEAVHPTGVELNAASGEVYIGKTRQLTASVLPVNADDRSLTWSSSDPSVATVDENGLVTGVAEGQTTITVTTNDGGFHASFLATVKEISYGTMEEPLTVEGASEVLASESPTANPLYVKGLVTNSTYDSAYNNYTIWLRSTDGYTAHAFELYHTRLRPAFGTDTFTDDDALVGMTVVASGYGQLYNGTPELTQNGQNYPYVEKIEMSAEQFAAAMIAETQWICNQYSGEDTSSHRKYLSNAWDTLAIKYGCVDEAGKETLVAAEADEEGSSIEQAVARYDFLAAKYGFTAFIVGRPAIAWSQHASVAGLNGTNGWSIALVAMISVSALATGAALVLRKKKQD